jgi:magnesium-transporting ATPase (P-type)
VNNTWTKKGETTSIADQHRKDIEEAYEALASNGLRVLCLAYKCGKENIDSRGKPNICLLTILEQAEKSLTFVGLVGMRDAPRKDAKRSIRLCNEAGITVRMVTGDHPKTAISIAKQVGIINDHNE